MRSGKAACKQLFLWGPKDEVCPGLICSAVLATSTPQAWVTETSLLYGILDRGEAYLIPTWLVREQRLTQVKINQSTNQSTVSVCMQAGPLTDDELHTAMVKPLRHGVRLHAVIDACQSCPSLNLRCTARARRDGWSEWQVTVCMRFTMLQPTAAAAAA